MERARQKSSGKGGQDAIAQLLEDHKKVQKLFKQFDKLQEEDEQQKADIVRQVCAELTIHAQIEEEIFYPAVREAIDDEDLMDEAEVEHTSAKELIAQLEGMQPGEELYDAKFTVLGEYVNHHIKEEQEEMFPKAKKAKLDMQGLGGQLMQRKHEMMAEMGIVGEQEQAEEEEAAPRKRRAAS
jgi:hypothetical protein